MPSQNSLPDSPLSITIRRAQLWVSAAFFLALAIQNNYGRYSTVGMVYLSLAMISATAGVFMTGLPQALSRWWPASRHSLHLLIAAYCAVFIAFNSLKTLIPYGVFGLISAALWLGLLRIDALKRLLFPSFLLFNAVLWVSTIRVAHHAEQDASRFPFHVRNDVQTFAEIGAQRLSAGQNPYSVKMPNVMGRDMPFYAKGMTDSAGRLPFGYPYLPLSLLWALPGYWLSDFRFMHAVAILGAAAFFAYARPSLTSHLAATFFLLLPTTVFILLLSWIEPVAVFFLGATVFFALRFPRWLFLPLGCLLASKQYIVFLLPLLPLLVPEQEKRAGLGWKAIGVAALLTLPLALWDVEGFWRSVVAIQFKQPFRADSLSYLVTYLHLSGHQLSGLLGFVALFGALAWGLWRAPRGIAGWCGAGAVAYLGFFAFNKQAFANYYFWPFGLLVAAVALALPSAPEEVNS